jgi:hypothetical protein
MEYGLKEREREREREREKESRFFSKDINKTKK